MRFVASRQPFQVRDQFRAIGYSVCADLTGDARPQYLLSSSWTYLQKRLECLTIHPRPREAVKLSDDLI
jgi:hypothetical protein